MAPEGPWPLEPDTGESHPELREQVRTFLDEQLTTGAFTPACNSWLEGHSPTFSRQLGRMGWLGMTWPRAYGGRERPGSERFVVLEELLAAGAPVAAHWMAERQVGPSLLRFGTPEQRERLLPSIAAGELYFSIGLSEPDAGSDLASVRTTATRTSSGWKIRGTKVWTSHAHRSDLLLVLCRTSGTAQDRHCGLSQLIVDLHAPGVHVNPIGTMGGHEHFAEVVLEDVHVGSDALLGIEGNGWAQVSAELAHERSGPERILSTFVLLAATVEASSTETATGELGELMAELIALRGMSRQIASAIGKGAAPSLPAAIVKDLGTSFEQRTVEVCRRHVPTGSGNARHEQLMRQAIAGAPGFTLRGGTTEILRGIVAKGVAHG